MDTDMPSEWGAGSAVASPPPPPPPPPTPGYAPTYPPPTGYGPPGAVADRSSDGVAIAALVVGIASVPFFWGFGLVAVAALILGGIALGRTARGRREGRGMALAGTILGAISLATFIVWAVVLGLQEDTDARSNRSAPTAPAPPPVEDTVEIPRPTSEISLDQVFAPIPGYVMTDAPAADVAAIREEIESEPTAKAVMADLGGRDVRQNGRRVARVFATTFDGVFAQVPEAGEEFVEGAADELLTRQDVTIGGLPAVSGTDDEGNAVIVVYKNTVGLVVGGPNMVALEQFTTKLLGNIPVAS
jgi:hypothetical protein